MRNQIRIFLELTRTFDVTRKLPTMILVLGGLVLSLFELAGMSIILPMLGLMLHPENFQNNFIIRTITNFTGLTSYNDLTIFTGFLISAVFITKNLIHIVYLKYEFRVLTTWRISFITKLYDTYMHSDYEVFMNRNSSRMIHMISSIVPSVINNYLHKIISLANHFLTGLVILAFMLYVNWQIAILVMMTGVFAVFAYSKVFKKVSIKLGKKSQDLNDKQYRILQQSFAGYKETKSHLKEQFFSKVFSKNALELSKSDEKLILIESLPNSIVEIVIMLLLILIFEYIALTGSDFRNSTAEIGAIVLASIRIIPVINRSIVCLVQINSSYEHVIDLEYEINLFEIKKNQKLLSHGVDVENVAPLSFENTITLKNINYCYPESKDLALTNINLTIKSGQFLGITGPSGSGKTTLVSILLGFLNTFEGELLVDDVPITRENIFNFRKIIGFVDQQVFLMDATIAENVAYGVEKQFINRDKVVEALQKAQLLDYVKALPDGIDTSVGENGKLISGGQRQRLAIARAFYRDIKILILDEASSSLDVETEFKIFDFLQTLRSQLTVIMIAHRLTTLKGCDEVLFIDSSRILEIGSFDELVEGCEKFKSYVSMSSFEKA